MTDQVLLNDSSRYGLRRLHVVQLDKPPSKEEWLERLPGSCLDTLNVLQYEEKGLGIHHLWMWWNAREVMTLVFPDRVRRQAVLWYVGKGVSFRQALADAATRHYMDLERDGNYCVTRNLPAGTPIDEQGKPMPVEVISLGRKLTFELSQEDWVPKGYLVVMEDR